MFSHTGRSTFDAVELVRHTKHSLPLLSSPLEHLHKETPTTFGRDKRRQGFLVLSLPLVALPRPPDEQSSPLPFASSAWRASTKMAVPPLLRVLAVQDLIKRACLSLALYVRSLLARRARLSARTCRRRCLCCPPHPTPQRAAAPSPVPRAGLPPPCAPPGAASRGCWAPARARVFVCARSGRVAPRMQGGVRQGPRSSHLVAAGEAANHAELGQALQLLGHPRGRLALHVLRQLQQKGDAPVQAGPKRVQALRRSAEVLRAHIP